MAEGFINRRPLWRIGPGLGPAQDLVIYVSVPHDIYHLQGGGGAPVVRAVRTAESASGGMFGRRGGHVQPLGGGGTAAAWQRGAAGVLFAAAGERRGGGTRRYIRFSLLSLSLFCAFCKLHNK